MDALRQELEAQNVALDEHVNDLDIKAAEIQASREAARTTQRLNEKFIDSITRFMYER